MYCTKIIIPKLSDIYKLYVYCSKSPEDINTIAKVKTIRPTIIIDESTANTHEVNGQQCYIVYDTPIRPQAGVTYEGPVKNIIPVTEYETEIDIVKINNYTYVNKLIFNELPIVYNGTMLYYSVIGVDEANGLITHLSRVNGVMIDSDYRFDGTRHLYSCDDYKEDGSGIWNYVSSVSWDEPLEIGDISNTSAFERFGIPVVETVPIFKGEEVNASLRPIVTNNFMVLEIPNPWKRNNKTYNYRKLKSYKLQNVSNEQYSDFSEPTYQSLLPVSIEKMVILRKEDQANPDTPIGLNDTDAESYMVVRKDGIYYNAKDHRKLGLNKYNIPLEETVAVFSESSVQDEIKMQVRALPNHVYSFTIYLFDVYGKVSAPAHFVVTT